MKRELLKIEIEKGRIDVSINGSLLEISAAVADVLMNLSRQADMPAGIIAQSVADSVKIKEMMDSIGDFHEFEHKLDDGKVSELDKTLEKLYDMIIGGDGNENQSISGDLQEE